MLLQPIEITKIRAGRPKPGSFESLSFDCLFFESYFSLGLAAQHLAGLNFVAKLCNAEFAGIFNIKLDISLSFNI